MTFLRVEVARIGNSPPRYSVYKPPEAHPINFPAYPHPISSTKPSQHYPIPNNSYGPCHPNLTRGL
ncbi:hypothetical protein BGW80DRAFT_1307813, partial [Lactifluus volemus]